MRAGARREGFVGLGLLIYALASFSTAEAVLMNTHFTNTTGNVATDYHLRLVSSQPINIANTYQFGGDVAFSAPTIQGSGSTNVSLDFAGATVNNGQTVHVGFYAPNNWGVKVAESFWTFGGLELMPRTGMKSAAFDGLATEYLVERISLYSDLAGTNLVGTMWWEDQAASLINQNFTTKPVFASTATLRSPTLIPLEDLNYSLGGFGTESPIRFYAPVPEPEIYAMLLAGLGLLGFTARRKKQRETTAA